MEIIAVERGLSSFSSHRRSRPFLVSERRHNSSFRLTRRCACGAASIQRTSGATSDQSVAPTSPEPVGRTARWSADARWIRHRADRQAALSVVPRPRAFATSLASDLMRNPCWMSNYFSGIVGEGAERALIYQLCLGQSGYRPTMTRVSSRQLLNDGGRWRVGDHVCGRRRRGGQTGAGGRRVQRRRRRQLATPPQTRSRSLSPQTD